MTEETESPEVEAAPDKGGTDEGVEERARAQGWVSADEWEEQGKDPEAHKPAEQFLADGKSIAKVQSRENDQLWREVKTLRRTLETMASKQYADALRERLNAANAKRLEAVKDADEDAFNEAEAEVEKIRREAEKTPAPSNDGVATLRQRYPWAFGTQFNGEVQAAYAELAQKAGTNPGVYDEDIAEQAIQSVIEANPVLQSTKKKADPKDGNKADTPRQPRQMAESGGSGLPGGKSLYDKVASLDPSIKDAFEDFYNNPQHPWSKLKKSEAQQKFVAGLKTQGLLKEWGLER